MKERERWGKEGEGRKQVRGAEKTTIKKKKLEKIQARKKKRTPARGNEKRPPAFGGRVDGERKATVRP
jgi:hypothetical protein